MKNGDDLRGEERKIVSTRLYRLEFANFNKICASEGKSVNAKLREMVRGEVGEGRIDFVTQSIAELKKNRVVFLELLSRYEMLRKEGLKLMHEIISEDPKKRLYEYHFFLLGVMSKTINLMDTSIIELYRENQYSLVAILRTFMENWACLHYFQKYPNKQQRLIWGDSYDNAKHKAIHSMDMLRKLEKDTPESITIMKDYEEMCQVLHPNRKSHLVGTSIRNNQKNIIEFTSSPSLDDDTFSKLFYPLINLSEQIFKNVERIDDYYKKQNGIRKEIKDKRGSV